MFTLTEALQAVADRSFYEDATITPLGNGRYTVEDDFSTAYAGDSIMWSYDGGMELPANVTDHSRLHETYEFYDNARHVSYNLPHAVELLEAGHTVTFAYAIVEDLNCFDGSGDEITECEDCQCDRTVGWTLLAFDHGLADN
jgi:hypothetical protein